MKKLLGYLFLILGLILINQKIEASQSNELKLKKITINTKDQEFYKISNRSWDRLFFFSPKKERNNRFKYF